MNTATGDLLVHEIAPRLCSMIPRQVIPIAPEDPDELCQDGVALAAQLLDSCMRKGKAVTPGNIAHYTVQLLKSGRRSTGSRATDPLAPMTRLQQRAEPVSTEAPASVEDGETLSFADFLADDRDDPGTVALRRVSWEELGRDLTPRETAVVTALGEGHGLRETARQMGLASSALTAARNSLADRIRESWGDTVVNESAKAPAWVPTLRANRRRKPARMARE